MIKLLNIDEIKKYIVDDPVRPHLSAEFRTSNRSEVYGLYEDKYAVEHETLQHPLAIICVAYTNDIPSSESKLIQLSQSASQDGQRGTVAVFYTVWSYEKGAGRQIVLSVSSHIKETMPWVDKWVTLSPLTKMAERFHLKNGALFLDKFDSCQNFDYTKTVLEDL